MQTTKITSMQPSLLAYQNTLNDLQIKMQSDPAKLAAFQANPLPALLNANLPVSLVPAGSNSTSVNKDVDPNQPVIVHVKWWGIDIIMNESLSQEIANGIATAGDVAKQLADNMNTNSEEANLVDAAVYAIAAACMEKSAEIKSADKGSGVHWPISWFQWLAVLASVPYGAPTILASVLIFIHPAPNKYVHQPVWHWGQIPSIGDSIDIIASLSNSSINGTPCVFVLDSNGDAQACAYSGNQAGWGWTNLKSPGTAKIVLSMGIAQVPNANYTLFCMCNDNHIWLCSYDGNWVWSQGPQMPDGNTITSGIGILALGTILNVFGLDNEGALWSCNNYNNVWNWVEIGTPGNGVVLELSMSVIEDNYIPNVMAMGSDNNLYSCFYQGEWKWANLGNPNDGTFPYLSMGTFTVNTLGSVFGIGNDNNLKACYYDKEWMWADLGRPDTSTIIASNGSAWVNSLASIFGVGSDGNLWTAYYDKSWIWACLGQPSSSVAIGFPLGSLIVGGAPNAFCVGTDGNLYTCWNS